jgi:hypothetical protein
MAGSAIRQLLFTIDFHVARHLGFLWVVHATVLSDDRGLASMSLSDALTAIEAAQSRTIAKIRRVMNEPRPVHVN